MLLHNTIIMALYNIVYLPVLWELDNKSFFIMCTWKFYIYLLDCLTILNVFISLKQREKEERQMKQTNTTQIMQLYINPLVEKDN